MAVSHIASNAAGSNSSFVLAGGASPNGVIVFAVSNNLGKTFTGLTHGTNNLVEIAGSPITKGTGETAYVSAWFLGSGIETGNQTVSATVGGTGQYLLAGSVLGGDTDLEIVDSDLTINSDSQADPSVTLSLAGRTCFCSIALFSGQGAPSGITPLTDWTNVIEFDAGNQVLAYYRYNTIDTADVTAGWTQTADDALAIAVAIAEVEASGQPTRKRMGGVAFAGQQRHVWQRMKSGIVMPKQHHLMVPQHQRGAW